MPQPFIPYILTLMKWSIIALLVLFAFTGSTQNRVPNPSFEGVRNLPIKPNLRKSVRFEKYSGYISYVSNLSDWLAGTEATPDLRIHDPDGCKAAEKRFGICDKARTGNNCVGIITFMEHRQTPIYREYLQVKLKETIQAGVPTHVSFWAMKERDAQLVCNQLGAYFSRRKVTGRILDNLKLKPQVVSDTVVNRNVDQWVLLQASFIPKDTFNYLLIGNFADNTATQVMPFDEYKGSKYIKPYAYYLIDDVRVWQDGDEQAPLVFEDQELQPSVPLELSDIVFDYDSDVLLPISFVILDKLVGWLKKNDTLSIQILGHTDDQGATYYNQNLSEARAAAVVQYLIAQGIEATRLSSQGYGETRPVANNETEDGRQRNRRVEIVIQ